MRAHLAHVRKFSFGKHIASAVEKMSANFAELAAAPAAEPEPAAAQLAPAESAKADPVSC
jgi:hypothetical protein